MVSFVSSHDMKYILVDVDCIFMLVEADMLPNSEGKSITTFLKKNIFSKFETPSILISNGIYHFWNDLFRDLLEKYGVKRKVETPYHP